MFAEVVAEFLEEQQYRGNTPKTLGYYRDRLNLWERETGATVLADFSETSVRRWILSKRNLSPATVANYDRALRVFAAWLYRRGYATVNPLAGLPKPKGRAEPIPTFSPSEITLMLREAKAGMNPLRDVAMMTMLLDTGMRIGEACSLTLERVLWQDGCVSVTGKTGERVVPFGRKTKAALRIYIDRERKALSPRERFLFLLRTGDPLHVEQAKRQLTRIARRAEVKTRKVGPHTWRHTFAVEYIRAGGDAFSLQMILGHSTLEMTREYVRLGGSDLREAHRRFSPASRML